MERPKNLNKKNATATRLVIIFHLVGLAGFSIAQTRSLFIQLVPYHLLLMAAILCYTHQKFNLKFILFFLVMFTSGFMAEWLGIHTGLLFGDYQYGPTLGFKVDNVPLLMGINWFILVYAAGTTLKQTAIKQLWLRVLTGATILVLLDFLIEPAAIKFYYWRWTSNTIPLTNYICWFVISALLLLVFELCKFKKQSIVGAVLLISQFIFFLGLLADTLTIQ